MQHFLRARAKCAWECLTLSEAAEEFSVLRCWSFGLGFQNRERLTVFALNLFSVHYEKITIYIRIWSKRQIVR